MASTLLIFRFALSVVITESTNVHISYVFWMLLFRQWFILNFTCHFFLDGIYSFASQFIDLVGSFFLDFDGACAPDAILYAHEEQVYGAAGATAASCATSAEDDLAAKLVADRPRRP